MNKKPVDLIKADAKLREIKKRKPKVAAAKETPPPLALPAAATPAVASPAAEETAAQEDEAWAWTPEREKAVQQVVAGIPKTQIADKLGVHRNTVNNWCKHPEFVARVRELTDDRVNTTRQRRHVETQLFTDKIAKAAHTMLDVAIKNPKDGTAVRAAREWLGEYRSFRAEERIDTGDNVAHVKHEHEGSVNHSHTLSTKSFKGFMQEALGSNIIDAECIEANDVHGIILQATQQALVEGTLLDDLAEEERHLKLDAHTQVEKKP